jgi:hypothetical protein
VPEVEVVEVLVAGVVEWFLPEHFPFGEALPSSPFRSKQLVKLTEAAAASISNNVFIFISEKV